MKTDMAQFWFQLAATAGQNGKNHKTSIESHRTKSQPQAAGTNIHTHGATGGELGSVHRDMVE